MKPADTTDTSDAEQSRLQELSWLRILDTPAEPRFDCLTRLVADVFGAPVVMVGLIDRDRQWIKSAVGTDRLEIARELTLCTHALDVDFLEIPDVRDDCRFQNNPFVCGEPFVRFYAGAVLSAEPLGTLCLIDFEPRQLSAAERDRLRAFAKLVEREINVERRDPLTGLFDAVTVEEHIGRALHRAEEHGQSISIMHLRVMNTDELVTLHGRDASDRLLRTIAERLRDAVRHDDIIGRAGGDGFSSRCRASQIPTAMPAASARCWTN